MSIRGQVIDLFNPAQPRGPDGKWVEGLDVSAARRADARVGGKVLLPDGKYGVIKAIGPPAVPQGMVHVAVHGVGGRVYQAHELGLTIPASPPNDLLGSPVPADRLLQGPAAVGPPKRMEIIGLQAGHHPDKDQQVRDDRGVWGVITQVAGLVATVAMNDRHRYVIDWRNGEIRKDLGTNTPVPPPPAMEAGPLTMRAGGAGPETIRSQLAAAEAARLAGVPSNARIIKPVEMKLPGGTVVVRDPHPPNPLAPWKMINPDGSEFHIGDKAMRRLFPAAPSPPGEMVTPRIKQYVFPGMPEPVAEYGHASAPVQRLRDALTSGALGKGTVSWPGNQGVQGQVRVVKLPDGTEVISKTQDVIRNDREELSYYVSQVIVAGAPAVARDPADPRHILMSYVTGQTAMRYLDGIYNDARNQMDASDASDAMGQAEYDLVNSGEGQQIGILDYLISNSDRHNENWMVGPDGAPIPIDNGSAQFDGGDYGSPFAADAPGSVSTEDVNRWRTELEKIEPEFTRLGRADWYMGMMQMLDSLDARDGSA